MLIKKYIIDEELGNDVAEGIAAGFIWGLLYGLLVGILAGLTVGLSEGLTAGLIMGLITGLVAGLVVGLVAALVAALVTALVTGLTVGLATGLIKGEYGLNIWLVLGILYLISELVYLYARKQEGKKINSLTQVLWRKLDAFFSTCLIGINLLNIWWLSNNVDWISKLNIVKPYLLQSIGLIGVLVLIIGIGMVLLWLNMIWGNKVVKR